MNAYAYTHTHTYINTTRIHTNTTVKAMPFRRNAERKQVCMCVLEREREIPIENNFSSSIVFLPAIRIGKKCKLFKFLKRKSFRMSEKESKLSGKQTRGKKLTYIKYAYRNVELVHVF